MYPNINHTKIGLIFFRLAVLLLVSAPFFALIFFLLSLILGLIKEGINIFKEKWNNIFLGSGLLMIFIAILHQLKFDDLVAGKYTWESSLSLIGLLNWIPLFICFPTFQIYLRTSKERKFISKLFVAGSFPLLISGFGQYWFDWHGPLEFMNGLIIWFQRPTSDGLTGLFNNQNYAGSWLNIVWPFSIAILFEKTKNIFKNSVGLLFVLSIITATFLTASRNAIGGFLLTIPLVLESISFLWIISFLLIITFLIILKTLNFLPENFNLLIDTLLPAKFNIFSLYNPSTYKDSDVLFHRNTIFLFAINMIANNPLIGLGAASFPIYYYIKNNVYINHTHNLIIDTAFNYGIPFAIIIFLSIFKIVVSSFKNIYFLNNNNFKNIYFEKAWWTSFFILLCSQMFDVQYYDGRISIAFWILLAGLKCNIDENIKNNLNNKI